MSWIERKASIDNFTNRNENTIKKLYFPNGIRKAWIGEKNYKIVISFIIWNRYCVRDAIGKFDLKAEQRRNRRLIWNGRKKF